MSITHIHIPWSKKETTNNKIDQYRVNLDDKNLKPHLDLIDKEIEELKNTRSPKTKKARLEYLKELISKIDDLETKIKYEKDIDTSISKLKIKELKDRISNIVDKDSIKWKQKAIIEMIFNEWWSFEEWYKKNPFYAENWVIIAWVDTTEVWPVIGHPDILKAPENIKETTKSLNKMYNEIREIHDTSSDKLDTRKYVWIIYDILENPKLLSKYESEYANKDWFQKLKDKTK